MLHSFNELASAQLLQQTQFWHFYFYRTIHLTDQILHTFTIIELYLQGRVKWRVDLLLERFGLS